MKISQKRVDKPIKSWYNKNVKKGRCYLMTKKEMFARIATVCSNDEEIVNFCNHEIELLGHKKSYKRTSPTKGQVANAELMAKVREFIAEKGVVTCKDIEDAFGLSNQKVSALLRVYGEGLVKTEGKGKTKATWAIA